MIDNIIHNTNMFSVMTDPRPHMSTYNANLCVGQLRYNPNTSYTEVYDGNNWVKISQSVTLNPGPKLMNVVDWVERKQQEEQELALLMEQHPGLKEAKERFDIMLALVKDHSGT